MKIFLFSLFLLFIPIQSYGRDVITFQWTANTEILTGYKLYYTTGDDDTLPDGKDLPEGDSPILILGQSTTKYTVTGLSDTETYLFALTAFYGTEESGYSEIVTVAPDSSFSPTILNIMVIK